MTTFAQDLRNAFRRLVRNPGFTAVLDAAVLRPLPYRNFDELRTVAITHREGNGIGLAAALTCTDPTLALRHG